jgi:alkylhydroperoxidase family enzyme
VVANASPDDATFARMTARFSPAEIVELIMVIGHYMLSARVMATAEIDLDTPAPLRELRARPRAGRAPEAT